jgi:hypothetical protein
VYCDPKSRIRILSIGFKKPPWSEAFWLIDLN